jgi:hypothetical protein
VQIHLSERQKELITGISILAFFGLSFGVAEGSLRAIQLLRFGMLWSVERSSNFFIDPATGLRFPRPNTVQGRIRINSRSFRSPEIVVPKPGGTVRLAFLGSSTTYDPYVDNESTWASLTVAYLGRAFPACRFDYVNAGLPGISTRRMLTHWEHNVAPTDPDIAVVLPGDISFDAEALAQAKKVHSGVHHQESWLARHSLLWSKVEKNVEIIRLQRTARMAQGKLKFEPRELSAPFAERLDELVQSVQRQGKVAAVLTITGQLRADQSPDEQVRAANASLFYMPYMSISGLLAAKSEYSRVIADVARRRDAVLIDGDDEIPGDRLHFADSEHLTAAGTRAMARRVGERLARADAFRRVLREVGCGGSS